MKLRQISIVLGVIIIIGGYALNNYMASLKKDPEKKPAIDKTPSVLSFTYSPDTVDNVVAVTGRLMARKSIQVISEVQGKYVVSAKEFREGESFEKGQIMISVAPAELPMNLKAQKSTFLNTLIQLLPDLKIDYPKEAQVWEAYVNEFNINESLEELPEPADSKLKLFLNSRNIYASYYNLKATEVTLAKYQIAAPFSGMVSSSNINPGMLIRPGQALGTLINPNEYELEFALADNDLKLLKIGDELRFKHPLNQQIVKGKLARIASYIDLNTQTAKVFGRVQGTNLKEGMYVSAEIIASPIVDAIEIDRRLLDEGNKVFLIVENKLQLKEVDVARLAPKSAIIRGLTAGDVLLNQSLSGAFEGMLVK